MLRFAFLLAPAVSLAAFAGCSEKNPESCEIPGNCDGGPDDGGGACKSSTDCVSSPSYPICDTDKNGGTCVQCTADDKKQCTGTKPVCDLTTEACTACVVDEDCGDKGVCLPDGSCAADANILHASSTALQNNDCSAATPCQLSEALNKADATKNVIRLADNGTFQTTMGFLINKDITLDGRGATITRKNIATPSDGPILTVTSGKKFVLLGGRVSGATGNNGDAIQCMQATLTVRDATIDTNKESGIDSNDCAITVSRSKFRANQDGGIVATKGTFNITGSLFQENGTAGGSNGGIVIGNVTTSGSRLDFNTIIANQTRGSLPAGAACTADIDFVAKYNVIWDNNKGVSNAIQTGGGNTFAYSFIGPLGPNDAHNTQTDPMLTSTTDGHPKAASLAKGYAQANADITGDLAKDLDGKPRVVRNGAGPDVGAYVVPEQ